MSAYLVFLIRLTIRILVYPWFGMMCDECCRGCFGIADQSGATNLVSTIKFYEPFTILHFCAEYFVARNNLSLN